jgi:hypothetical protein
MNQRSVKRCIVLLADGARVDVFSELLGQGRLKEIDRWLVQKGMCSNGVTSFPSTTGPGYLPFLTGSSPGTCNVPGIRWLDKSRFEDPRYLLTRHRSYVGLESFLMGRDMRPDIKTIFEMVDGSYSIFNPIARGARWFRNKTRYARIWYWYYAHLTDHWELPDDAALKKTLAVLKKDIRFVFTVFPGIDEYSHLTHPHHEKVIERYLWLDAAIGEIASFLAKQGEWENTQLWLVSDHGLSKTDHHFCVNTFLEKHDLPPFFYPLIFEKKGKRSANMVSGNGMTHLYFKNDDGWRRSTTRRELARLSLHLLSDLTKEEAIDIIACRNEDGGIDVISRQGEARIRLDGHHIHYEVMGSDPFGYPKLPVDLNSQGALEATIDTDYPDAPFQLAHLFTASRTGDVVLSATPGYDLRLKYEHPEHKASHGSLHRSHMMVPILCSHPFEKRPMRTVDVFPTILKSLDAPIPHYIDGTLLS